MTGPDDSGPRDLAALHAKSLPNRYFICPAGYAPDADADGVAPVFSCAPERLRDAARQAAFAEPNTAALGTSGAQDRYLVRSRAFAFPDDLWIETLPVGDGRGGASGEAATLAILSQSRLGATDFGANKRRVQRLIGRLTDRLPTIAPLRQP